MGTGSHRPQFEAAKGRPDELGGITHARSLKSHTRLKYRDPIQFAKPIKAIESSEDQTQLRNANKRDTEQDEETLQNDSSSEEDSDLEEMQRELDRLRQRELLRQQKHKHSQKSTSSESTTSKWRSDTVSKRKKKPTHKSTFLDKFIK